MVKPADTQLEQFIDRFEPAVAATTRAALKVMRKRFPGANQLVYDNYNALAIGFSATDRVMHVVFSIAVFPRRPGICFFHGAKLDDPTGMLTGGGKQVRFVYLDDGIGPLHAPAFQALMAQALANAPVAMPAKGGALIIKSISAKQRPRRSTAKPRPAAGSSPPRRRSTRRRPRR